jgi:hypothetical protein
MIFILISGIYGLAFGHVAATYAMQSDHPRAWKTLVLTALVIGFVVQVLRPTGIFGE